MHRRNVSKRDDMNCFIDAIMVHTYIVAQDQAHYSVKSKKSHAVIVKAFYH
jgi:hypothetical protein